MRWILAQAVCLLAFCAAASAETYAVLPFANTSVDKNLDWIGESVAETVAETLAAEGMMVPERSDRVEIYRRLSVKPYARLSKASVIKIGENLDAEEIVYGEFELRRGSGDTDKRKATLQIRGRVLDLKHLNAGPEFEETGALEDLAALQNQFAWQTLHSLRPQTAPTEQAFRARHPAVRVDAIENYVRGLMVANADDQHHLFTQAAHLDASYSQPALRLGRLEWNKKDYKSAAEWFQRVPATSVHYREASFFLGLCRFYLGDYAVAQQRFQSVADSVPLNEVWNNLGAAQSRRNLPEALDSFRKALDGDAKDPAYQFNVGYVLWKRGSYDEAAKRFKAVLDTTPADESASLLLARCLNKSGPRPSDTRTEGLERVKTNYEESQYFQLKAVLQPQKN